MAGEAAHRGRRENYRVLSTLHHVVPLLPPDIGDRLVSLVDLIFDAVDRSEDRHLMLCSAGTQTMGVFEHHLRWERTADRIIMPDAADQQAIHAMIYELKSTWTHHGLSGNCWMICSMMRLRSWFAVLPDYTS